MPDAQAAPVDAAIRLTHHGSILLFIRHRLGLHHQREKSNRCLGYEGVTSVQLRHASTGQSKAR